MYKLLIVDDNVRERNGTAKLSLWKELGFDEIYTAQNGQEGFEKALSIKPMLIVSDVSMAVMDGLLMARKIMEHMPDVKFIFISCFDETEYIRSAIDLNAFAYLLKPVNISKLRETVVKILNISETERRQKDTIEALKNEIDRKLPIIREQVTRDWFYGNSADIDMENLASLNLDIRKFCAVCGLQINNYEKINLKEKYLIVNWINNLLRSRENESHRCYSFIQSKSDIGIILYIDNAENENAASEFCIEYFEHIKEEVNKSLNVEISIYVGGITSSYADVPKLFEGSDNFMRNGICAKSNSIIFVEEAEISDVPISYDVANLKPEIFNLLDKGNTEEISGFVEKYISAEILQSVFSVRKFVFTVISSLQLIFVEMNEDINNVLDDEFLVWERIAQHDTIPEVRNMLNNILRFSMDYLQSHKKDRNARLVEDIKNIIATQYATLKNVEQITSQTFFSATHANLIFKKHTGDTIFDYLTWYKIEQAKKMLSTGQYKVYEVSDLLGYKNKNYFGSLFKEYTGDTPSHYRDSAIYKEKK